MPLTEHLVDLTTVGNLIFQLILLFIPIIGAVKALGICLCRKIHLLNEIFSVEEIFLGISVAFFKERTIIRRFFRLAKMICHFCRR